MIRRPPRSTHCISSAASDVYKRQACSSRSAITWTDTSTVQCAESDGPSYQRGASLVKNLRTIADQRATTRSERWFSGECHQDRKHKYSRTECRTQAHVSGQYFSGQGTAAPNVGCWCAGCHRSYHSIQICVRICASAPPSFCSGQPSDQVSVGSARLCASRASG